VLGIFSTLVNDYVEIFMHDFIPYGNGFDESLANLGKVLKYCKQTHLSLSTKKIHMKMNKGVFLVYFISSIGI
jgi:hypothetical protein